MELPVCVILVLLSASQVLSFKEGQLIYPQDLGEEEDIIRVGGPPYKRGRLGLSSSQRKEFLNAHNKLRKGVSPEAANMELLEWDRGLERLAQEWADSCVYEHPNDDSDVSYKNLGQNLYFDVDKVDVSVAVKLWYNEVEDYDFTRDKCQPGKICTHYTQVVWASSNRVGCGLAFCPSLSYPSGQTSYNDAWYYVCQYSPRGNMGGLKPYIAGKSGTQCESGTSKDGLCSRCRVGSRGCECKLRCQNCGTLKSNCQCSCPKGYEGTSCSVKCEDRNEKCNKLPGYPKQACGLAPYIAEYCPLMCEVCTPPDPDFVC